MAKSCKDCKFNIELQCRRYPPTVTTVILPGPPDLMNRPSLRLQHLVNFPQITDEGWCGEYSVGVISSAPFKMVS